MTNKVNVKSFCKYINDLSDHQLQSLMYIGDKDISILLKNIKKGKFNGVTYKDNISELNFIIEFLREKDMPYSKQEVIIAYLNHYIEHNGGIYNVSIPTVETISDCNIVDAMLCLSDDLLDVLLNVSSMEDLIHGTMLVLLKSKDKNKPDKKLLKELIYEKILCNPSRYNIGRFVNLLQVDIINKKYFLETLKEVCIENNNFYKLYDLEIYDGFKRDGEISEFLLDMLVNNPNTNFSKEEIDRALGNIYKHKMVSELVTEILPYDIKYISIVYKNIMSLYSGVRAKHIRQLSNLAHLKHPQDVEKCDMYEYCLPLRKLFIVIKSCILEKITNDDKKFLGKTLCGLLYLHNYNFDKILDSLYANKTSVF